MGYDPNIPWWDRTEDELDPSGQVYGPRLESGVISGRRQLTVPGMDPDSVAYDILKDWEYQLEVEEEGDWW